MILLVGSLVVLSVVVGVSGVALASQASAGAALVGLGCLFAILARIAQAGMHHRVEHPDTFNSEEAKAQRRAWAAAAAEQRLHPSA